MIVSNVKNHPTIAIAEASVDDFSEHLKLVHRLAGITPTYNRGLETFTYRSNGEDIGVYYADRRSGWIAKP